MIYHQSGPWGNAVSQVKYATGLCTVTLWVNNVRQSIHSGLVPDKATKLAKELVDDNAKRLATETNQPTPGDCACKQ